MQDLFQAFQMADMIDVPIKHLSKGTIQKVAVIQALLDNPMFCCWTSRCPVRTSNPRRCLSIWFRNSSNKVLPTIMSCHERFLVNQLAHDAYEISDHQLNALDLSGLREIEYMYDL